MRRGVTGIVSAMLLQKLSVLSLATAIAFCLCVDCLAVDVEEVQVTAPSAEEYLGQYTFFRGWTTKRRVVIVKTNDTEVDRLEDEAVYNYRCQLAIRNINLVLCSDNTARETVFFHSEDNRRDFIQTRNLSRDLRMALDNYLRNLHRDLNAFKYWALLLDYDGGRKRMYKKLNFQALLDKVDSLPLRQREMEKQKEKQIECK
jgi:hypothetical protein